MMRVFFLLLCILLGLPEAAPANSVEPDLRHKRVFLLYSYHPTFPTAPKVLAGIRSVFGDNGPVIDIEYMDSKRLNNSQSQANFLTSLEYKLSFRDAYDIVITADDNALDFVREHGKRLFPGVPTVFLGVNNIQKAKAQNGHPLITGVIEAASFRETLALMKRLQPQRNRVHVVVDGTTSGQADLKTLQAVGGSLVGAEIEVISLRSLSWSEYSDVLESLGVKDAILLLSAYQDRHGEAKSFSESLEWLTSRTSVPVYHLWEHGLGQGVLGGVLVSHREQGRQAALMAQRVLLGEPTSRIPVLSESPNVTMLDYQQLYRFGIDNPRLPVGSIVSNQPDSIWFEYRNELIFASVLLMVLMLVTFYLARQNIVLGRMSKALYENSRFVRLLMDTIPDLVWMKDADGVFVSCNQRFERYYGAAEADIVGKTDFDFVSKELAEFFVANDRQAIEAGGPNRNEERVTFASDGHEELLETIKTPVVDGDGQVLGVLGVARDITRRRAAEKTVRVMSQAVEQSPVSVMIADEQYRIEYVNNAFEKVTGYTREEVQGRTPEDLCLGRSTRETYQDLWVPLKKGQTWEGEFLNRKKTGEVFWEYAHIVPFVNDQDAVHGYLSISEDITLRKQQQEKILYQAQFDALTGLPNRVLSFDRLQQSLLQSKRQDEHTAVLFIDLDDFKKVNDSLGHHYGDELLIQVADRLRGAIRKLDTVGRLGGDEFLVLLGGVHKAIDAGNVASQLIGALASPFTVNNREILLSASIGISVYPEDGETPQELLRKADTAMYSAKRSGRAGYAFFTNELNANVSRRFMLEEQLHGALARKEFYLEYQPQVDVDSGIIVGFEALLRWNNEALGDVSPEEFIPVAEQTSAIVSIGRFVIETALKETRAWCADTEAPLTLAVNMSPVQFRDETLTDFILSALASNGVAPANLELEITESVVLEQHIGVYEALKVLHDKGVRLAIDDFGTGYSSLSCLRSYPFDTLKIDREFTQGITEDEADYELVFALISMANGLGLKVIAEGVETEEQRDLLNYHCCDLAQGFYYSKSVSAADLAAQINGLVEDFS